jgi:hypothetical protein
VRDVLGIDDVVDGGVVLYGMLLYCLPFHALRFAHRCTPMKKKISEINGNVLVPANDRKHPAYEPLRHNKKRHDNMGVAVTSLSVVVMIVDLWNRCAAAGGCVTLPAAVPSGQWLV